MLLNLLVVCALNLGCLAAFGGRGDVGKIAPANRGSETNFADTSPVLFPLEEEIELALKAAPVHLRTGATVYAFGKSGYERKRIGTNGFNCLVNRDGTQNGSLSVYPTCWDPEGTRTILPVMLRVGELLAGGKSAAEISSDIDAGFKRGQFQSPAKTGIAFMLAGDVKFDPKTGRFGSTTFPPHYMIYAPGVSNADIGVSDEALKKTPGLPFVYAGYSGGSRTAYIIVMAGGSTGHQMN